MNDDDFEEVLEEVRLNKSETTGRRYVSKIEDFRDWLDDTPFEEADARDVNHWLAELDDYYANASSVGKASAALVAAYEELNVLISNGYIDGTGWPQETPPERATYSPNDTSSKKERESKQDLHYLKPEQVDKVAQSTDRLRNELIVRLLFQTGLRVSELCETRLTDLDTEERSIHVRGKGRKNRTVYYQPSLDLLIDVWLTDRRPAVYYADESDYLFPTTRSENITRETVATVVREAADDAGLQEVYGKNAEGVKLHAVTPHVLRHSFAMAALSEDWDVYTLSQALGHASTEITTSTYLHDDEEEVRRAYHNRGPAAVGN